MAKPQPGDTVTVHYTGTLADNTVFDSSRDREPLEFTVGASRLIPGFEAAVLEMQPGETRTVRVPADQAYGPRLEELIATVDRGQLPPDLPLVVGEQYQFQQPDGNAIVVTATEVTPSQVTFDANHPLAGQDLTFEIELVAIR